MVDQSYEEKKEKIDRKFLQGQIETVDGYLDLIRDSMDRIGSDRRAMLINNLEKIATKVAPFDPEKLEYGKGVFDPEYAKDILKKLGLTSLCVAEELGMSPSNFSRGLSLLHGKSIGGRKKMLIYFAEKGYDPDNMQLGEFDDVLFYIAKKENINDNLLPYTWYKDIVILGAQNHKLPYEYIAYIKSFNATTDPDQERDKKNRLIICPKK